MPNANLQNAKPEDGKDRAAKIAVRCTTALIGGYFAAAGLASLLARLLRIDRAEATVWGMMVSFLIYAIIGLWAFYEQRLARVAGGIWGIAIFTIMVTYLLGARA